MSFPSQSWQSEPSFYARNTTYRSFERIRNEPIPRRIQRPNQAHCHRFHVWLFLLREAMLNNEDMGKKEKYVEGRR